MEENGRKKKNSKKKKKTKQPAALEDNYPINAVESSTNNEIHAAEIGLDMNSQVSRASIASDGVSEKTDSHLSNGIKTHLANSEEYWMDREANFQKKVDQLQAEKDEQMDKEAALQEKVKELLKEKDENLQKLTNHEETIKQLRDENSALVQKESSLKEKLEQLMKENAEIVQKKDYLEEKIEGLQVEKDAHLQKEYGFEESITALSNDNTILRSQVEMLEGERNGLSEEKQELTKIISSLQLQINNLGGTSTCPHIEHNDMVDVASDQKDVQKEDSSNIHSNPGAAATLSTDVSESYELTNDFPVGAEASRIMPVSHSMMSLEEIMRKDDRNDEPVDDRSGFSGVVNSSKDIIELGEIEQVPLDGTEVKGSSSLEATTVIDEINDASLIDAPLIGAPFRFMSFVARYVSGADLVK